MFVAYGLLVAAATLGLDRVPLGALAPGEERAQRRAQGLDALSYGIGGTAGPAAVAALATLIGARAAMLTLAAAAVVAGR